MWANRSGRRERHAGSGRSLPDNFRLGRFCLKSALGSPSTGVTGLTAPGMYVFTLNVVDRKVSKRDVTVTVLQGGRS